MWAFLIHLRRSNGGPIPDGTAMIDIGYRLNVNMQPVWNDFSSGANAFVDWLTRLRAVPSLTIDWVAVWEQGGELTFLLSDTARYLKAFEEHHRKLDRIGFVIWAGDRRADHTADAELEWAVFNRQIATIDIYRADPPFGIDPAQYIDMIRITTAWQRPQHLSFGPTLYHMFDHPLDRSRSGIGWMGWIPFALTSADVPEAALVMPMNGGTFIQSVPDFWQAPHLPRQPDAIRDEGTIARVQDVEIRLNLLGVLPTAADLATGNWGR
jgi:hypothetical protein